MNAINFNFLFARNIDNTGIINKIRTAQNKKVLKTSIQVKREVL